MATDTAAPAAQANTQAATAAKPKTEVRTIKMKDGRTVDFPGKRRLQKSVAVEGGKVLVRLDFENGETMTCELPQTLMLKAAGHGLSQKLGDEISGVTDLDDAVEAVDDLIGRIAKGEWNETATGGEGLAGASILMRALMEHASKSREEIKAFLSNLKPKEKAALREAKGIKEIVTKLEAEKAAKSKKDDKAAPIDTSALLASLSSAGAKPPTSAFDAGDKAKATPAPATPAAAQKAAPKDASGRPAAR